MRFRRAFLLAAALVATPAAAQDMDFSKIKCRDFLSSPKDQVGTILVWLEGFYSRGSAPPIMYQDKTMKDARALDDYCNAHGDDDIIKAAEAVMPVK
jgi:hypothetical protein